MSKFGYLKVFQRPLVFEIMRVDCSRVMHDKRKHRKCLLISSYQAQSETSASLAIPMVFLVSADKLDIKRH